MLCYLNQVPLDFPTSKHLFINIHLYHKIRGIRSVIACHLITPFFHLQYHSFIHSQSSPEHWENFTRETLQESEATRQRSVALRGTLDAILINASRDLRTQADKVEAALSKRIACTDEIRIRLENELKKVIFNIYLLYLISYHHHHYRYCSDWQMSKTS